MIDVSHLDDEVRTALRKMAAPIFAWKWRHHQHLYSREPLPLPVLDATERVFDEIRRARVTPTNIEYLATEIDPPAAETDEPDNDDGRRYADPWENGRSYSAAGWKAAGLGELPAEPTYTLELPKADKIEEAATRQKSTRGPVRVFLPKAVSHKPVPPLRLNVRGEPKIPTHWSFIARAMARPEYWLTSAEDIAATASDGRRYDLPGGHALLAADRMEVACSAGTWITIDDPDNWKPEPRTPEARAMAHYRASLRTGATNSRIANWRRFHDRRQSIGDPNTPTLKARVSENPMHADLAGDLRSLLTWWRWTRLPADPLQTNYRLVPANGERGIDENVTPDAGEPLVALRRDRRLNAGPPEELIIAQYDANDIERGQSPKVGVPGPIIRAGGLRFAGFGSKERLGTLTHYNASGGMRGFGYEAKDDFGAMRGPDDDDDRGNLGKELRESNEFIAHVFGVDAPRYVTGARKRRVMEQKITDDDRAEMVANALSTGEIAAASHEVVDGLANPDWQFNSDFESRLERYRRTTRRLAALAAGGRKPKRTPRLTVVTDRKAVGPVPSLPAGAKRLSHNFLGITMHPAAPPGSTVPRDELAERDFALKVRASLDYEHVAILDAAMVALDLTSLGSASVERTARRHAEQALKHACAALSEAIAKNS